MQNLVCHYSLVKGEQILNREPCTPGLMLGIVYELLCPCLQLLQSSGCIALVILLVSF